MGWSIDSKQDSTLVVNALDMAIRNRQPEPGGIVHADHGTQFTSWVFGDKIRSAGLLPSFGTVGDGLDNAMMESFWSSMQIELLNRQRWKTRVELANAIFDYIDLIKTPSPLPVSHQTGTQTVGQVIAALKSTPLARSLHWPTRNGVTHGMSSFFRRPSGAQNAGRGRW